jgi:hypothetical protein
MGGRMWLRRQGSMTTDQADCNCSVSSFHARSSREAYGMQGLAMITPSR